MSAHTRLVGKIFIFNLPVKEDNFCISLKNNEEFISKVMDITGCIEIQGLDITGAYTITFSVEETPFTDKDIIEKINSIANKIGFED